MDVIAIKNRISTLMARWRLAKATVLGPNIAETGQSQQASEYLMEARVRICEYYHKLNEYFSSRQVFPEDQQFMDMGIVQTQRRDGQTPDEEMHQDAILREESEAKDRASVFRMKENPSESLKSEAADRESHRDLQLRELEVRRQERQEELAFRREERQKEREIRRELSLQELALKKQELDERHERAMERLKYKRDKLEWLKSRDSRK